MTVGPKDGTVPSADAPHGSTDPDLDGQACVGFSAGSTGHSHRVYAARPTLTPLRIQSANGFGRPLRTDCTQAVSARDDRSHWSGWMFPASPAPRFGTCASTVRSCDERQEVECAVERLHGESHRPCEGPT